MQGSGSLRCPLELKNLLTEMWRSDQREVAKQPLEAFESFGDPGPTGRRDLVVVS